ncbi:MAG: secretin N-terminal domain-containing protein [Planctomycetota bacterium]
MPRTTACRRATTAAGGRRSVSLGGVRLATAIASALLVLATCDGTAFGQTDASTPPGLTAATRAKLQRRVTLNLPGVPLREALMSLREVAGVNLVINQELKGTVDLAFRDAPVHEVLDTLLLSRGLGYRPVGDGLVVVPIADLGAGNPLLATETIPTPSIEPQQLLPIVQEMLSPEGRAHALGAGRSLVVFDYPSRLTAIRAQVAALDASARQIELEQQEKRTPDVTVEGAGRRRLPGGAPGGEPIVPLDSAVVELLYVPATEMATALTPLLGPGGQISAMANENRLLLVDTPTNLRSLRAALQSLDVPRVQVRIRALIYDCSVEDGRDLGLNWGGSLRGRRFGVDGAALDAINFSGVTAAGAVSPTAAGAVVAAETASRYLDLNSTIRALNESSNSRLLADPNVVVLNHEEADIKIVTEVPFQELTQSALGGAIGTTNFREAGVRLQVTPHIAADRTVTMLVHPEFSVLSGFTPDTNAPIIDTREATTTVRIADRETLVLGGLRQRSKVRNVSSLPFFGSVPLAGRLFRRQDFEVRESELLVFLTPEIVDPRYSGDCRETGVAVFGRSELEATPICPEPMGAAAAIAEDRAEWNRCHFHKALMRGRGASAGSLGEGCDLPPEVFAAPSVSGLIGPADSLAGDALPPAPAPAEAPVDATPDSPALPWSGGPLAEPAPPSRFVPPATLRTLPAPRSESPPAGPIPAPAPPKIAPPADPAATIPAPF